MWRGGDIDENWILLDNQSTVDVFSNPNLLEPGSIHETDGPALRITSTGGVSVTRMVGFLAGYGWVWFYADGCANILSKHRVRKRYDVTCDDRTSTYTVHAPHGPMRFVPSARGLHYYDARQEDARHEAYAQAGATANDGPPDATGPGDDDADSPAVPTISGNARRLKATNDDIKRAEKARALEAVLCFPSPRDLKAMVRTQSLRNLDITVADIDLATALFGPSVGALRGKSTLKQPGKAEAWYIDVPRSLQERLRIINLSVDVFFVSGMPYM